MKLGRSGVMSRSPFRAPEGSGLRRVLLVDDQPDFCALAREMLVGHPRLQVVGEAHTGEEALEAAALLHPDVVLLDIEMPGMGGLAACRELARSHPGVTVVIVSFHSGTEFVREALRSGAVGLISKRGLSPEALERVIA